MYIYIYYNIYRYVISHVYIDIYIYIVRVCVLKKSQSLEIPRLCSSFPTTLRHQQEDEAGGERDPTADVGPGQCRCLHLFI